MGPPGIVVAVFGGTDGLRRLMGVKGNHEGVDCKESYRIVAAIYHMGSRLSEEPASRRCANGIELI